jgi:hypothetical protein
VEREVVAIFPIFPVSIVPIAADVSREVGPLAVAPTTGSVTMIAAAPIAAASTSVAVTPIAAASSTIATTSIAIRPTATVAAASIAAIPNAAVATIAVPNITPRAASISAVSIAAAASYSISARKIAPTLTVKSTRHAVRVSRTAAACAICKSIRIAITTYSIISAWQLQEVTHLIVGWTSRAIFATGEVRSTVVVCGTTAQLL